MSVKGRQCVLILIFLWTQVITVQTLNKTASQKSSFGRECSSSDDCSGAKPVCCGKTGYSHCRTSKDCVGVPCSSSFECDNGRMWCCSNECKDSACLLPVWAIVLIALAAAIIVSLLLIYVILQCCRRWPNIRRTLF